MVSSLWIVLMYNPFTKRNGLVQCHSWVVLSPKILWNIHIMQVFVAAVRPQCADPLCTAIRWTTQNTIRSDKLFKCSSYSVISTTMKIICIVCMHVRTLTCVILTCSDYHEFFDKIYDRLCNQLTLLFPLPSPNSSLLVFYIDKF